MRWSFIFLFALGVLPLLFIVGPLTAGGQGQCDLVITEDSIFLSDMNPSPGEDVTIYASVRNNGDMAEAKVRFYNGDKHELIGEEPITVPPGTSALASTSWNPNYESCDITVIIEEVSPYDSDPTNNHATVRVEMGGDESPLELASARTTFEGGIERVIPIQVTSTTDLTNVTLSVIYRGDVEVELLSPPLEITAGEVYSFYIRIEVPELREDSTLTEEVILLRASNGDFESNLAEITITIHPSVESGTWWSPTVAVAAGTLGVFAIIGGTEVGKYKFISFVGPLYTKLHGEKILDHYIRGKIHGYILANPGEHYNSIRKALEIPNGSFTYHLQVLERECLIKSRRDGIYRRFYPYGAKVPKDGNDPRPNGTQKIIIEKIRETPGISQKEMALHLGASRSTINYHINKLVEAGIVKVERRGMSVRYFLTPKEESQELVRFIELPSCQ